MSTPAPVSAIQANGDLNNTAAERARKALAIDTSYLRTSFAIPKAEDDADIRGKYRPFLLDDEVAEKDWIARLELCTVLKMVEEKILKGGEERLKVLVLYGSMRKR